MIDIRAWGSAVLVLALIGGCGKSDDKKPATQVAAKVNGDEISVHQINAALMQAGTQGGDPKEAGRQALERLIDQQLLVQKSVEAKLDRDPNVLTAIENARRQILAQAYVDRTLADTPLPTNDDIKKFYADNPEIFARRRLYRFQEVLVAVENDEQLRTVQAQLEKNHDLRQFTGWLRERNLKFNTSYSIKASEQIPRGLLTKLSGMKQGDVMFYPGGNRALAVQVTGWQELPMSEPEAAPYIVQALVTQKRGEAAAEEVKRLRTASNVDYVGEFAKTAGTGTGAPEAQAAKPADSGPAKSDANLIDKGLTGLK